MNPVTILVQSMKRGALLLLKDNFQPVIFLKQKLVPASFLFIVLILSSVPVSASIIHETIENIQSYRFQSSEESQLETNYQTQIKQHSLRLNLNSSYRLPLDRLQFQINRLVFEANFGFQFLKTDVRNTRTLVDSITADPAVSSTGSVNPMETTIRASKETHAGYSFIHYQATTILSLPNTTSRNIELKPLLKRHFEAHKQTRITPLTHQQLVKEGFHTQISKIIIFQQERSFLRILA